MKKNRIFKHKGRSIVLFVLLALVCVSGAEVLTCRRFAPELYQRITAPARAAWKAAEGLADQISVRAAALAEAHAEEEEEAASPEPSQASEGQFAQEPVLLDSKLVSDPSVTELTLVDGQEILTGGTIEITYYNQSDSAWASLPYGSDNIGSYGCGPAVMAMAVASLTDQEADPNSMAQLAVQQGYWARRSGSYLSIVSGIGTAYGLQVESLNAETSDDLCDALLSGKLVVALMGPGHFTQRGHFILLRGVTLSGEILVADPNSRDRSLASWEAQLILDELSASTSDGAPLWTLSVPE
jgi:hypothetical protein